MGEDFELPVPDSRLEELLDVVDEYVLEETRETSRANLRVYLEEISHVPPVSRTEARGIARQARSGDLGAKTRLTEGNLRLVVQVARRYVNRGLSLPDLIEEGNLGLLGAVERYDPERSVDFPTYAVWWIRQTIVHALAEQARAGRVAAESRRREAAAERDAGGPSAPKSRIEWLRALLLERTDLAGVLDDLAANERTVLRCRLGLGVGASEAVPAVAQRLGLSEERVSQVEASAVRKVCALLAVRGIDLPDAS